MSQPKPNNQRLRPLRWLVILSALLGIVLLFNRMAPMAWAQEFVFLPLLRQSQSQGAQTTVTPAAARDDAIQLVAAVPEVADWLARYPGWVAQAYQDENNPNLWYVYFTFHPGEADEEWLGKGSVDVAAQKVLNYFVPRELTPEEFAFGLKKIQTYLKYDPETTARFGNTNLWQRDIQYNRWRGLWEAVYTRQPVTDPPVRFIASLSIDATSQRVYLDQIQDEQVTIARASDDTERNQAIQLTWEAEGVGEAVLGHDNIEAYVEPTASAGQYTVEFHDNAVSLFWALVDIYQWQVLEAGR